MQDLNRFSPLVILGCVLIALGTLIPSDMLIDAIRNSVDGLRQKLLTGAMLFKVGLVALGCYTVALNWIPSIQTGLDSRQVSERPSGKELAVLTLLVAVAILLRLYKLDYGIWLDEMLTFVNYMPMSVGDILSTYDDANNHLLFTVLARVSFWLFGESTWALRLPAVLFGVASIPALYFFARKVVSGREALFCAALFTLSYHHIWFSQNARGYTALLFWTLVSSTFFIEALRSNRPQQWIYYAIAASMGAFVHLSMGFLVVAHISIYLMWALKQRPNWSAETWNGILIGFMLTALLCFQIYALVLPQMIGGGLSSGAQGTVSEWTNPLWTLLEIVRGMRIGFTSGFVALLAFIVFSVGVIDYFRREPIVLGLLFIPTSLGFLVMISIGYTLFPRFFFFAIGFGVMVAIRGAIETGDSISRLLKIPEEKIQWMGITACTSVVLVSSLSVPFVFGPKQNYDGALNLINEQRVSGDSVVALGIAGFPFIEYFKQDWVRIESLKQLDQVRASATRTWLVYMMPVHAAAAYPEIYASIEKDFETVQEFYGTLNGGTIVVCRTNSR